MKFFQKRWVAITLCILMIVASLAIGQSKEQTQEFDPTSESASLSWAEENYGSYTRYIRDEADILSERTIRELSEYNAAFDYTYNSICGVGIVEDLSGADMEDAAFELGAQVGLGERDYFLLLNLETEDWYFVYGDTAAAYVDHELEILLTAAVGNGFGDLDEMLIDLFEELERWYGHAVPVSEKTVSGGSSGMVAGGTVLFVMLIVFLVIAAVCSSLLRAGRRVVTWSAGWWPLLFLHDRRPRSSFGPRPGSGSRPVSRPSSGPRPVSHSASGPRRSSGGFGSSSRGNFNRGGGFGGGNRGGGSCGKCGQDRGKAAQGL